MKPVYWFALAVAGASLAVAAYRALLCPPRWWGLSERHMMAVLIGAMLGGVLLVLVAGIQAVAS